MHCAISDFQRRAGIWNSYLFTLLLLFFCGFLIWSHSAASTALFRSAVLGQCLPSERKAVEVEGLADICCDILQDVFCTSAAAVVLGTWRGWPGGGSNIASADCRYATTVLCFL